MKTFLVLIALLFPFAASAQTVDAYGRVLTCSGQKPIVCHSPDGITAANDAMGPIIQAFNATPPAGVSAYAPPPTTIAPLDFMARLTPVEQSAIANASQSNAQVLLFLLKLTGATAVDVTDALTQAGMAAMIAANLITSARGAQILDLSRASP
jgi:hypothetical protein